MAYSMIDCRDAIIDYSNLSQDDPEAEDRYEKTKQCDPFPEIPPALLNSADIYDYVRMTGMLHPFDPSPERLKAASYEACILGECRYWDNDGVEKTIKLEKYTDVLTLPPNSIAFVQVEPYFRLPVYIGIRFNLKIRHVHRGILLGTGPLVDPGYRGKLLIPLHNLTTNEYKFNGGDALIWIEFTKTSQNSLWDSTAKEEKICFQRLGVFNREEAFPRRKADLTPQESLARASPHKSIRSSIPVAMQEAAIKAKTAAEDAAKAKESADEAAAHFRTIRR